MRTVIFLALACLFNSTDGFSLTQLPILSSNSATSRSPARTGLRSSKAVSDIVFQPSVITLAERVATGTVFEPQAPPMGSIVSIIGILSLAAYWWLVFVPSERRDLAANKNKGGLNSYLDKLAETPQGERQVEKWFYTEWLQRRKNQQEMLVVKATSQSKASGESFETVLARLREEEVAANIERSKAMPSFLSFDNPILVATVLTLFGILVAAGKH